MRHIFQIFLVFAAAIGTAMGQGTVQWTAFVGTVTWQTNTTAYSPLTGGGSAFGGAIGFAGGAGPAFRYELLYGPEYNGSTVLPPTTIAQLNFWTDTGLSATNGVAFNGRIVAVAPSTAATLPAGWIPGHTNYVILVGWSANLGSTWAQAKNNLNNLATFNLTGHEFFGTSTVGYVAPGSANPGIPLFSTVSNSPTSFGQQINAVNAQLYVLNGLWTDTYPSPVITQQPSNQTVNVGAPVTFNVQATNNPPFIYQWRKNNLPISNATNSTLTINSVSTNDAGSYNVTVANIYGSTISSSAILTVLVQTPAITAHPQSQTIAAGTALALSVAATNAPPFTYQWYFNNTVIPGETNAALNYNPTYTNDSGSYRVDVSNVYGTVNSSNAAVFVYQPALIATPLANQLVSYGDTASFGVAANGFPLPTYQWTFNGSPVAGATASSLLIPGVTTNKLGTYSVTVSNAYGSASSSATLTMRPSFIVPFAGINGLWGQPGTLSVSAVGSGTLAYQWYKDGVAIAGANAATYFIPSLQFTNAGDYSVVVTSAYGSVSNTPASVNVRPSDTIFGVYAGITVQGSVGNTYLIQYSTDLVNWNTATNITLTETNANWADFSADFRNNPGKYYRVIPAP